MYCGIWSDERGMFSLLGLFLLGVMLFMGLALLAVAAKDYAGTQAFLQETRLHYAAESGIETMRVELEDKPESVAMQGAAEPYTVQYSWEPEGIVCEVSAMQQEDMIWLVATSRKAELTSRCVACLKKQAGRYLFDHWEP